MVGAGVPRADHPPTNLSPFIRRGGRYHCHHVASLNQIPKLHVHPMSTSPKKFPTDRASLLAVLRETRPWDLIVIGGGATGLGTALDAAARGFRTLLLESHDFAKGTSSRSTKLVHGGVRYLAQGNIHLVREALRERGLLRRNAPQLVHDMGFIIPAYDLIAKPFYGIGLTMYDLLAGKLGFGRCRVLSKKETLTHTPTLKEKGLRGGILYHDGQFDDARLAITLLRTLFDQGGAAVNYLPVTGLLKNHDKINGVWPATPRLARSSSSSARPSSTPPESSWTASAAWTIRPPRTCSHPARASTSWWTKSSSPATAP